MRNRNRTTSDTSSELPTIHRRMLGWFQFFVRHYLQRNFHTVAVNSRQLSSPCPHSHATLADGDCLVVYANHASWWDPLAAIFAAQNIFPAYEMYAPIDGEALRKYQMFARMGFFGIDQNSRRGAAEFLQIAQLIATRPGASLWVTPEGRFADVRDTSAELMPGLSHLGWRLSQSLAQSRNPPSTVASADLSGRAQALRSQDCHSNSTIADSSGTNLAPNNPSGVSSTRSVELPPPRVWFIPAAVEYTFWEERQPELLMWFGAPLSVDAMLGQSKHEWSHELFQRLRQTQQLLASASISRDESQFDMLLGGTSGSFFIYDWWRKTVGLLRGRKVSVEHGKKLQRPHS